MNYHHMMALFSMPDDQLHSRGGMQIFLFSKARKIGLATSSPQTQTQQHIDFPTSIDKRSNTWSHTCYKQTINHRANAKM
jgi:hypothetical protein